MGEAIAGLIGALVGAAASIVAMFVQHHFQHRRELVRLATEIAKDDYERRLQLAKQEGLHVSFPPIAAFVAYHVRVLETLSKGDLDDTKIRHLHDEQEKINKAFKDLSAARSSNKSPNSDAQ